MLPFSPLGLETDREREAPSKDHDSSAAVSLRGGAERTSGISAGDMAAAYERHLAMVSTER